MIWEQRNSIVCSKSKAYRISKRSSSRGGLFGRSLRRGEGGELVRVAGGGDDWREGKSKRWPPFPINRYRVGFD